MRTCIHLQKDVIFNRVNSVQSLAFNVPPFCFIAVPFLCCLFSCLGGGTCAKIPAQPDISFSRPGTVILQEKYSVSVCFNARIFVLHLSLLSKRSS